MLELAIDSWDKFQNVLFESRGYTVTLFADSGDSVSADDLNYIRSNSEIAKVYYEMPENMKSLWSETHLTLEDTPAIVNILLDMQKLVWHSSKEWSII